jgi:DNA (cytosine-5)-methyltransferase 1|nr:MAG TPA: Cytosine specific methyltransferase [Caudoviricetes sp.]
MKHLGDITKIHGDKIEPVDCITFGSPCQDLSIAGRRAGLAGERSGLFIEAVRIIKEMRSSTNGLYPTFAVWENVLGAFSSNGGEDFRAVLEELARIEQPDVSIPRPSGRGGRWSKAGAIAGNGWSLAWRQLDAQYWGVPQRRKRIALVVDFAGQRAGEILFERTSLSRHPDSRIPAWKEIAGLTANCPAGNDGVVGAGRGRKGDGNADCRRTETDKTGEAGRSEREERTDKRESREAAAYSLKIRSGCAGGGKGALVQTEKVGTLSTLQDQTIFQLVQAGEIIPINTQIATRHISMGEKTGLGVGKNGDPSFTLQARHEHGVCYCIAGNIVDRADTAVANGLGAKEEVGYTLNTIDRHAVAYSINPLSSNSMKSANPYSGFNETGVSKTLDCSDANPTKNQGGLAIVQPIPIQDKTGTLSPGAHAGSYNGQDAYNDMLVRCRVFDARGNGNGKIVPTITGDHESRITDYTAIVTEPEDCLTPWDNQARRIYSENGTFPALAAREKAGQNQQSVLTETEIRWIVRRLTPTERERLQGYPDGWTDIGEWVDTKGKKHKPTDSPRYKALGNSIALPQWFWIAQKMKPYLSENSTLGSLFDGIGGFPLVWQKTYGNGTARWASEVDSFCIAVTKRRFGEE